MEEKETPVTQTEEKTEVTEVVETKAETTEKEVKTFTQEQVNSMLAKERKGLPSKEELAEFNKWKESQKSDEEKAAETSEELKKAQEAVSEKNKTIAMYENGVDKKYMDYVIFTVSKMEGDFNENLKTFLKDNSEYLKAKGETKATGIPVKTVTTQRSAVADILAKKHPECNF